MKYDSSLMWHKIITQDEKVILREVLSVLSKSSPYAVTTERDESISVHLDEVKDYLYIKTDIESDFKKALTSLSSSDKRIIFLCGSSGDGKSEVLTKYCHKFRNRANFLKIKKCLLFNLFIFGFKYIGNKF